MRRSDAAALPAAQQAAATRGLKGMIPIGRPFLDYVLSELADGGISRVCLVIGPEHHEVRQYYEGPGRPERVSIEFAVQAVPRGTADAVLAAEPFAAGRSLLVLNADNLYPSRSLAALRGLPRAGLLGFRRSVLVGSGAIPAERILAFALLEIDSEGNLTRIVEKPSPALAVEFGGDPLVSMNAWLLPPSIFAACRSIAPSSRGELELADAVMYSRHRLGERFRVLESRESVLDLSSPADIPIVSARLRGREVSP